MSSKFAVLNFEPRTEAGPVSAPLLTAAGLRCKEKFRTENECT
jgi:hypothetical protein